MRFFSEFLELGDIKNSGETFEQTGSFEGSIGRFRPQSADLAAIEISKIWVFGAISGNFQDFFFQSKIIVPN